MKSLALEAIFSLMAIKVWLQRQVFPAPPRGRAAVPS
jgi:hypothetical protein